MLELIPQPLTAESFAPFGEVIDTRGADSFLINNGLTRRYHDLARAEALGADASVLISAFVSAPVQLPVEFPLLERHPLGSQAFMPLQQQSFLVVVAPPGEDIRPQDVRAFVTDGRQGVNYRAGTWHVTHTVLHGEGEFLVVDRGGPGHNCDEHPLGLRVLPGEA